MNFIFKKSNFFFYYISIIIFLLFTFYISYYYGFIGLVPLDDFVNFNSGYRVLNEDLPFRDYYEITGPVLSLFQSIFFEIFGISWKSFVIHSSLINCLTSYIVYFFFNEQIKNKKVSFFIAIIFSILFYPNNGVPGVDHHAWSFSIIFFLFFYHGLERKNFSFIFFSIIFFLLSFFTKQVPALYFLFLAIIIYLLESYRQRNFIFFSKIFKSIIFFIIIFLFILKINKINIDLIFTQYFLMLINFSGERISNINLYLIKEEISKIYFLFFLIIPLIFFIFKKNLELNDKKKIIISIFFILFSLFYEIHTNNQAMTFALLPIVGGFIYQLQLKFVKIVFLEYLYLLLILLCLFKLVQLNIFFIIFLFIFVLINFYLKKKKVIDKKLNFYLIIYLFFGSFYYFDNNIDSRKYKDIISYKNSNFFDGYNLDIIFNKLKWNIANEVKTSKFIDDQIFKIQFLNSIENNYIFITDLQIYNIILKKKDYSPVKYWATNVSYPSKTNILRTKFEKFFLQKMINNKVKYVILDKSITLFNENLLEFSFLNNCIKNFSEEKYLKLEIYEFSLDCFLNQKI